MENRKEIEAQRVTRQLKQTAAEAYAERRNDIAIIMDCIKMELETHAERAAAQPKNWGFAGDLASIKENMTNILKSLMIGHSNMSETEAARFIADHLDGMRG
jgi:hypothetical protein